ncbi:hypothetical protein [Streptomyces sp. NBRC 110035]|uniref:hypothetical protein n=1 Tax=Streptomyces sp. NBRC 110035 TaxID=1547867 RepID=UPI0005AADF5C|nr:hypothetical protein [Streptomyces sp. NBRC 110035]
MARTSNTAKKTTSPAKKTTAKKTAPARTPRKSAAKTAPATPATPRLSLVKPEPARPHLPTRARHWMTDTQGHATLAARIAGIPTHRIHDWRDHRDGTATRPLADGSHLHYDHTTRTLTWHAPCPQGAIHAYRLDSPSTATTARIHADRCTTPHTDLNHIPALTPDELAGYGIHTGPTWARPDVLGETPTQSIPDLDHISGPYPEPRALGDQLTHSGTDTTATQPMNTREIAAALEARTDNDLDTAKEHPDHA